MYLETFEQEEKEKSKMKYVVTFNCSKDESTGCVGIYENYHEALGHAMEFAFEFVDGMENYSIKAPVDFGEESGEAIEVRDSEWNKCMIYIYFCSK